VNEITERWADETRVQRIHALIACVHAARAEIIDRGLDAVRVDRELALSVGAASRGRA